MTEINLQETSVVMDFMTLSMRLHQVIPPSVFQGIYQEWDEENSALYEQMSLMGIEEPKSKWSELSIIDARQFLVHSVNNLCMELEEDSEELDETTITEIRFLVSLMILKQYMLSMDQIDFVKIQHISHNKIIINTHNTQFLDLVEGHEVETPPRKFHVVVDNTKSDEQE